MIDAGKKPPKHEWKFLTLASTAQCLPIYAIVFLCYVSDWMEKDLSAAEPSGLRITAVKENGVSPTSPGSLAPGRHAKG